MRLHETKRLTENTQLFNVAKVVDSSSSLPNTLPRAPEFQSHMRSLRVRPTDKIICYDATPNMTAAVRAAYSLRHFGAGDVRVMNGGLLKWLREGRKDYAGPYAPGQDLPEEGEYDFEEVSEDVVIRDINRMHHIAYYLANNASDY